MPLSDDCPPSQPVIYGIMGYLLFLAFFLGYCLISFWPGPPLIVSSIRPNEAHSGDTQTISFLGSGFAKGLSVSFGDASGTIDQVDGSVVRVKLPQHDKGLVRVVVKNPTGQEVSIPNGFNFTAADIQPTSGDMDNELSVVLTGKGFKADEDTVVVGGVPIDASKVQVKSDSQLSVTLPKHAAGVVEVGVIDKQRQSLLQTKFTYIDRTQALAWPNEYRSNDVSNETNISFLFMQFWAPESVRTLLIMMIVGGLGSLIHLFRSFYWYVGNRSLTNSWLMMYIITPFNGAGLAVLFYLILRGSLPQAPANPTSLDGYAAMAALVGMFSQEAITKLKQIAGAFFATAEAGKDQAISPVIVTAITPNSGSSSGGTMVTLTGSGFLSGAAVSFDRQPANSVTFVSSTQLTAITPSHAAGVVDVQVANPTGTPFVKAGGFTYNALAAPPGTVTLINPVSGPIAGGTSVTITGTGFGAGDSVSFGGVLATHVTVVSNTQITVVTPARAAGVVDVKVTDAAGASSLKAGGFTFV